LKQRQELENIINKMKEESTTEGANEVLVKTFTFIISYLVYLLVMGIALEFWGKLKEPTRQFIKDSIGKFLVGKDAGKREEEEEVFTDTETDIQPDNQTDILADIQTDILADIQTDILAHNQTDILADNQTDILADIQTDTATDIQAVIQADIQTDTATDIQTDTATDIQAVMQTQTYAETDTKSEVQTDIQTRQEVTAGAGIEVDTEDSGNESQGYDDDEVKDFDDFSVYGIAESFVQDTISKAVEQCQLEQQIIA